MAMNNDFEPQKSSGRASPDNDGDTSSDFVISSDDDDDEDRDEDMSVDLI